MKDLLPYYERELVELQADCRELADRYPGLAGLVGGHGQGSADPFARQVVEACALLTARVSKRLDDDFERFTESLLEMMEPSLLRQFPPCSLVQFEPAGKAESAAQIARGSVLTSLPIEGAPCTFTTLYDTPIRPLEFTDARFETQVNAPAALHLPRSASACISITWSAANATCMHGRLRVLIDGDTPFCATLRDTLFMHTVAAYVQMPGRSQWLPMDAVPIHPVGFAENEAVTPDDVRANPAHRLLIEYFAFAEKFNFFDLDLDAIGTVAPEGRMAGTLHLVLSGVAVDSPIARMLAGLGTHNLLLHCTPVANLFQRLGEPIKVDHLTDDYPLIADQARPHAYEVVAVKSASLLESKDGKIATTPLLPYYSLRNGQKPGENRYWFTRQARAELMGQHRQMLHIGLVESEQEPIALPNQTISVQLWCSNGEVASRLVPGTERAVLAPKGAGSAFKARLLRRPTLPLHFRATGGTHWDLIAQISLASRPVCALTADEFGAMLALYDIRKTPATTRKRDGVLAFECRTAMDWIAGELLPALVPGIEIRMTVDPTAFSDTGLHMFAQVVEHFFGLYAQINLFTRLVVLSPNGEELIRCKPRSGRRTLA